MLRRSWAALGVLFLVSCTSTQESPQVPVTNDPEPTTPVVAPSEPSLGEPAANGGAAYAEPGPSATQAAASASSEPATSNDATPAAPPANDAAKPPGLTVAETRTIAVIRQIVLNNRQRFRACYEAELRKRPGQKGTLTLHFKIDPKGKISFAEVNLPRTSLKSSELGACALGALRQLPFPHSSRGFESEVNYPFDFRP